MAFIKRPWGAFLGGGSIQLDLVKSELSTVKSSATSRHYLA